MKLTELVAIMKNEQPALLGKLSDKKAARIIRAAFVQVGKEVTAAKDGFVSAPGLGRFRIKEVERTKDGQKTNARRVVFRASKGKGKAKPKSKAL